MSFESLQLMKKFIMYLPIVEIAFTVTILLIVAIIIAIDHNVTKLEKEHSEAENFRAKPF